MRNKASITLLLIIALASHVLLTTDAELSFNETRFDTPLITRIVSIDLPDQSSDIGFNEFQLDVVVEIWNNQINEITVDYPESCGFGVHIRSLTLNPESTIYSSFVCGDLTTPFIFLPGLTELDSTLIFSTEGSSNSLPNGDYLITYGNPNSVISSDLVSSLETSLNVNNGEILIENDPLPEEWGTTTEQQNINPIEEEQINPDTSEPVEVAEIKVEGEQQEVIVDGLISINVVDDNRIIYDNIVNVEITENTTENKNLNITQIFFTLSLFIGTLRFTKSKI